MGNVGPEECRDTPAARLWNPGSTPGYFNRQIEYGGKRETIRGKMKMLRQERIILETRRKTERHEKI